MPILTFTSDIGGQDYLTGAVKGQLLNNISNLYIVDLTHGITPFNYPQAAYICRNSIFNFPRGTVHLILVNLFDEKSDYLLLAEHKGHFICCANNGLLNMMLETKPEKIVGLPLDKTKSINTLNCTQVFANAIQALSKGKKIEELGNANIDIKIKNPLRPSVGDDWIEGHIIYNDAFENVVVNIRKDDFELHRKGRKFSIVFKRDEVIDKISETYADVPEAEKLALFNSAGYLEIAINRGNAAGLFGLQGYSEKQQQFLNNRMYYQTVKIFFED
jgi:S-adenosylmethionine hydrolase